MYIAAAQYMLQSNEPFSLLSLAGLASGPISDDIEGIFVDEIRVVRQVLPTFSVADARRPDFNHEQFIMRATPVEFSRH